MLLLLVLLLMAAAFSSSLNDFQKGQCHHKCASKFSPKQSRLLNDQRTVSEPLVNTTTFVFCKIGCYGLAGFDDLQSESIQAGRLFHHSISASSSASPSTPSMASPLKAISPLCIRQPSDTNTTSAVVNISLSLVTDPLADEDFFDFFVQVINASSGEEQLLSLHSFSTRVDVSLPLSTLSTTQRIRFRVLAVSDQGAVGEVISDVWTVEQLLQPIEASAISMTVEKQVWLDAQAAVRLLLEWPRGTLPVCALSIRATSESEDLDHSLSHPFELDETRSVYLRRLQFEQNYRVDLREEGGEEGQVTTLHLATFPCTALVDDPLFCPPPAVASLTWTWNSSETAVVAWDNGRANPSAPSVHFLLVVSSLPGSVDRNCQKAVASRRIIQGHLNSALVRVPSSECDYTAELLVIDARNRRSRPVSVVSSAVATTEAHSIQSHSTVTQGVLFWSACLLAGVLLLLGLLVYRHHRSNREAARATLKKYHPTIISSLFEVENAQRSASKQQRYLTHCSTLRREGAVEAPRGVYRHGKWHGGGSAPHTPAVATLRRHSDDGYAVCELKEPGEEQLSGLLAALPPPEDMIGDVPIYMSSFAIHQRVGQGRFGAVYRVSFPRTRATAALKKFNDPTDLKRELEAAQSICLRRDGSPSLLVSLLAASATSDLAIDGLFYEFCPGGDLRSLLQEATPHLAGSAALAEKHLAPYLLSFCTQIAAAVSEVHSFGFVHRDISCRNVLLPLRWSDPLRPPRFQSAKLGDVGLACRENEETVEGGKRTLCLSWQAPEVRAGKPSNRASDMWSFGCLLAEVASVAAPLWLGRPQPPDSQEDVDHYLDQLTCGAPRVDGVLRRALLPEMRVCLAVKAEERRSAEEMAERLSSLSSPLDDYSQHSQYV